MAERAAIAQQLKELRRARDRIGEKRTELGDLLRRHDAAEVVEPVKPERLADRIRSLERETVGQLLGGEADAVLALEQGAEVASDGRILVLHANDPRILERFEQPARAQ